MKNLHSLSLIICVLLCTECAQPPSTEERIQKAETSLVNRVYIEGDSLWNIEERMLHYGVPGVSIAVIDNYEIAWTKTYGVMDRDSKEPVTTKTLFQAGSISKPVAAYGALRLVSEGKLSLDQDVNTTLKSWKLPENEFTSSQKVTLKHLLSHTGGITVHGFPGYSPDLTVPTLLQVLDGAEPANSHPIRVDKLPGEGFRYSGGGYCIMQQMMIDVEGKDFPAIMDEKVLRPLGMLASTYAQPLPEEQLKLAATGYLPNGQMTKGRRHIYPEMAAAGLWTTAEDLARFAIDIQRSLKGEKSLLSQEITRQMLTPVYEDFIGLGIFLDDRGENVYFGHGGWDEGFSSHMTAHRDKGYGVVILTNSNHPQFIEELMRAVALAYGWDGFVPVYKRLPADAASLAGITGRYRNGSDGLVSVFAEGDRLFMKYIREKKPNELIKVSDSTYIRRDSEEAVQFKLNPADGKMHIVFIDRKGKPSAFDRPRMDDNEKIPFEHLLAGSYEEALKGYQSLMAADPTDGAIAEHHLNWQGYELMREGKLVLARDIFHVNTLLYPSSANVYDSYAEALMNNGEIELAIANYKKALKLDPANRNAAQMLKELVGN